MATLDAVLAIVDEHENRLHLLKDLANEIQKEYSIVVEEVQRASADSELLADVCGHEQFAACFRLLQRLDVIELRTKKLINIIQSSHSLLGYDSNETRSETRAEISDYFSTQVDASGAARFCDIVLECNRIREHIRMIRIVRSKRSRLRELFETLSITIRNRRSQQEDPVKINADSHPNFLLFGDVDLGHLLNDFAHQLSTTDLLDTIEVMHQIASYCYGEIGYCAFTAPDKEGKSFLTNYWRKFDLLSWKLLCKIIPEYWTDAEGRGLLFYALETDNTQVFRMVLAERKAELDKRDARFDSIAIRAIQKNDADVMTLILDTGFDLDQRDLYGTSLLSKASSKDYLLTKLLLEKGADAKVEDKDGFIPLHFAILGRNYDAVRLLASFSGSLQHQNRKGFNSLHCACEVGSEDIVSLLLEKTKDQPQILECPDKGGNTPLHVAALRNHVNITKILLDHGVKTNTLNKHGYTAKSLAMLYGNLSLSRMLPFHPADSLNTHPVELLGKQHVAREENSYPSDGAEVENLRPVPQLGSGMAIVTFQMSTKLCASTAFLEYCISSENYATIHREHMDKEHFFYADNIESSICEHSRKLDVSYSKSVTIVQGATLRYRYVLKTEESNPVTLERDIHVQFKHNRVGDGEIIEGHEKNLIFCSKMDDEYELYLTLGHISQEINRSAFQVDASLNISKVVVASLGDQQRTYKLELPLKSTEEFMLRFSGDCQKDLFSIQFEFFDVYGTLRASSRLSEIQKDKTAGSLVLPVICHNQHPIGSVFLEYLLVTPFHHKSLRNDDSCILAHNTGLCGHRGSGSEKGAVVGAYRRTHFAENTIPSFCHAALVGVDYVEFDVHVTRDRNCVVYHDFAIARRGVMTAIHQQTLDEICSTPNDFDGKVVPVFASRNESFRRKRSLCDADILSTPKLDTPKRPGRSLSDFVQECSSAVYRPGENHVPHEKASPDPGYPPAPLRDQFPSLAELFSLVPETMGFNVELKYPSSDEAKEEHLVGYFDMNVYLDAVLTQVFELAGNRRVYFSSFDPDICLLCRRKQGRFPVLLLTEGGSGLYKDYRRNSFIAAARFAQIHDLAGVVCGSTPLLYTPVIMSRFCRVSHVHRWLLTYGGFNNDPDLVQLQFQHGVHVVIADHLRYLKSNLSQK